MHRLCCFNKIDTGDKVTGQYEKSYAKGTGNVTEEKYRTVPDVLRHQATVRPNKTAFVFLSTEAARQVVTWKEIYDKSLNIAKALVELGVKPKELVAISVRDSPEWLYIHFGIILAGAIPFGLSFMTPDENDVINLLQRLGNCSAIFLDPGPNDSAWNIFKTLVESIDEKGNLKVPKVPSLRYCVCMFTQNNIQTSVLSLADFQTIASDDTQLPTINEDDIQVLFQSSGSTGVPKVIAHTHKSLSHSAKYFKLTGLTGKDDDVIYNGLPLRWMGGYVWNMYHGETRVTRSGLSKMPDNMAEFVYNAIIQEKVTFLFTLFSFVAALMERKLPSSWPLRTIGTGGQPVAKHFAGCLDKGIAKQFSIQYSSTETTLICYNLVKKREDFVEYACGRPFPGVEVKVIGTDGKIVPPYTRGEIHIRSEAMFQCYYNDNEGSKAVLTDNGWYQSGDIGYITDDGIVYVEGRKSDLIYSNDLSFSPAIMESVLNDFQGVQTSLIVSVPDKTSNKVVCACYVPSPGSDVSEDQLRLYLGKVSAEKSHLIVVIPKHFLKFDAFPGTFTGKASRKLVAEEAERRLKQ